MAATKAAAVAVPESESSRILKRGAKEALDKLVNSKKQKRDEGKAEAKTGIKKKECSNSSDEAQQKQPISNEGRSYPYEERCYPYEEYVREMSSKSSLFTMMKDAFQMRETLKVKNVKQKQPVSNEKRSSLYEERCYPYEEYVREMSSKSILFPMMKDTFQMRETLKVKNVQQSQPVSNEKRSYLYEERCYPYEEYVREMSSKSILFPMMKDAFQMRETLKVKNVQQKQPISNEKRSYLYEERCYPYEEYVREMSSKSSLFPMMKDAFQMRKTLKVKKVQQKQPVSDEKRSYLYEERCYPYEEYVREMSSKSSLFPMMKDAFQMRETLKVKKVQQKQPVSNEERSYLYEERCYPYEEYVREMSSKSILFPMMKDAFQMRETMKVKKVQQKQPVFGEERSYPDEERCYPDKEEDVNADMVDASPATKEAPMSEKRADVDADMVDASPATNEAPMSEKKAPKTPATPHSKGSNIVFIGSLPYSVEKADVENFFQAAGEIRDVSFAVDADDRFKGYCRVEFITAEAAEKAVEYNGDYLNDCQLRICLAHERVAYTPHSCEGNSSSPKEGRGRAHTVFMKGLDNFLGEDQV